MSIDGPGAIRTIAGDFAPLGGRRVDLVFRAVGERTAELALELAIQHVRPNRVHVVDNIRPFSHALERMLQIEHDCSHIVYWDADCLVLEDMRPFLDANELAYVDCYLEDRFRRRIHCGVHITRVDLMARMRVAPAPVDESRRLRHALRPESQRRRVARQDFLPDTQFKNFQILHDYFQYYNDIFAKYALRELRYRSEVRRARLELAMALWDDSPEFAVARAAIRHARRAIPAGSDAARVETYIRELPRTARGEVVRMGLPEQPPLTMREVLDAVAANPAELGPRQRQCKVFALGMPGTGTRSLLAALHELDVHLAHDPFAHGGVAAMRRGGGRFPALDHYDGLAGILPLAFLDELDGFYSDARFILTVCDRPSWIRSAERHWRAGPPAEAPHSEQAAYWEGRRILTEAICGPRCPAEFDPEYFGRIYDEQVARVRAYFAGRPDDLLILDIRAGEGWEKLAPFLGRTPPLTPFPAEESLVSSTPGPPT
jgi:hypothetical protein